MNQQSRRIGYIAVILAACVLESALVASARAEKLPSKEDAAAGWINLFDGETPFGWNQMGDAQWKVAEGNLVCETGSGGWLASTCQFGDYELAMKIRVRGETSSGVELRAALEGHPSENGTVVISIVEPARGETSWHEIHVQANGGQITATMDGKNVEGLKAKNAVGHVGIQYHGVNFASKTKVQGKVEVSEIKLKPLNLKSIFNGKDLSEWSAVPGHKSVFSVVDGAINIKNGNGQIESKGTYRNFTLQLDIYSNGDHLNSGVFYRTPVGVFWKGYESQVRNQWMGDDRTKPVDYGTGAIYGVQAARKVVSSDREWFYKTIVVDGEHAAVWINGYQVSDFTDTRPVQADKDGKVGYVGTAGTINLQGHDPTTDLSFKNIRIQTYPD